MTSQLANGCHSWVPKPCFTIHNETIISRSTTYYHTPDFPRGTIKKTHYKFYVVQIRDPLARFRSIFGACHLGNVRLREKKDKFAVGNKAKRDRQKQFSKCFPSLEDFALAAAGNNKNWKPNHLGTNMMHNCSRIPSEIFNNRFEYSDHWRWNHDTVYRKTLIANPHFSNATVLALRTESVWGDWISANQYLGQKDVYVPPDPAHRRGYGQMKLPVPTNLSEIGRRYLCHALIPDYKAYVALLRRASNIDDDQKLQSLKISQSNCPSLGLTMAFI